MRAALAVFALGLAAGSASGQPTPVPTPAGAGAVAPSDQTAVQPALPGARADRNVALGVEPRPAGPEEADTGVVVSFEAGRNVVLGRPDGTQVVYPVPSTIVFPPDLRLHGTATVYRVPLEGGGFQVTRLVAAPPAAGETVGHAASAPEVADAPGRSEPNTGPSPAAAGQVHRRAGLSGRPVTVTHAPLYTVLAIEAGKTLTLRRADGTTVVLALAKNARVPPGLAAGRSVTVRTRIRRGKSLVTEVRLAGDAPILSNVN